MTLQILVDMNLSPDWTDWFTSQQWPAVHWSVVGDPKATDETIMAWARSHQHVVFTHDLDFGTLLALTNAAGPSVIQLRTQNVFPEHLGKFLLAALKQHEELLEKGALIVVDESEARARVLPLRG
jgi:predicted nuclease of predicted toxin-antitoxin system